jgi:putative SOS response-associated peptidase YedK
VRGRDPAGARDALLRNNARMCGRFTLATPKEILAALFGLDTADWNDPRFNIAPQTRIVTVRGGARGRSAQSLLWGALNPRDGKPVINARVETVATTPLFSAAFAGARVLVPADGFFEWTKHGPTRLGHYFRQAGSKPFAFGGIAVQPSRSPEPSEPAAVILTGEASESVRSIHDRMPLIIPPPEFDLYLDPATPLRTIQQMLARSAHTPWTSHPVGPAVNNVRNDSPENIRRAEPADDPQRSLF